MVTRSPQSMTRRAIGWRSDVMPAVAAAPFVWVVVRVHDGDGLLWCRSGQKIRVASIQAPDFTSAEPCRRPDSRRANYTCDDQAATRSQQIVSRLVLGKQLTAPWPTGGIARRSSNDRSFQTRSGAPACRHCAARADRRPLHQHETYRSAGGRSEGPASTVTSPVTGSALLFRACRSVASAAPNSASARQPAVPS
jgi:hypothetical protein